MVSQGHNKLMEMHNNFWFIFIITVLQQQQKEKRGILSASWHEPFLMISYVVLRNYRNDTNDRL